MIHKGDQKIEQNLARIEISVCMYVSVREKAWKLKKKKIVVLELDSERKVATIERQPVNLML